MRPFELIGVALVVGIFVGLVVLMSTRNLTEAAVWLGITFIVVLVLAATVVLMIRPGAQEIDDMKERDAAESAAEPSGRAKPKKSTPTES
jgi:predicted ferric reductase